MLTKFNDEQLQAIGPVIDPEYWIKKFRQQKADVELVRQVVEEAKL